METKEICINILKKLDIYKPYIRGFESKKEKVCFFENYTGFWVYQEKEIEDKMKEIEKSRNCKVYAITHEYTEEMGEMWDFLFVPNNAKEYDNDENALCNKLPKSNAFLVWSMTWNKTDDFIEEGDIAVKSFGGGILRVG